MRVLHGPVNIANQPWVLSRAERRIGLDSSLVVNYGTSFGYPADTILSAYGDTSRKARCRRWLNALTAPLRARVQHYYFGRSFSCWDDYGVPDGKWFFDLKLAKRLGCRTLMTLQGCDARLSDLSAQRNPITPCTIGRCRAAEYCREHMDPQRRHLIEEVLPMIDRVFYLNPELGHYVSAGTFLPYACVDIHGIDVVAPRTDGPIRILHAPSDESTKGSAQVYAAIDALKEKYPIEFLVVKGVTHERAMQMYREADFVIDQLLYGWYGGFAVEVMAMGKPVGAYIREEDLHFVPQAMVADLPVIRLHGDTLTTDLEAAILERDRWPEIGTRSRRFVEKWHDPVRIAHALARIYRDPRAPLVIESTVPSRDNAT
ncbi:MAG: hypothetical protein OJJ55_04225 [Rhodococcus sp.]|nr:hypothetical protein [Rhodococcus sp. (in: high G+C Gram-positive bacteria)]